MWWVSGFVFLLRALKASRMDKPLIPFPVPFSSLLLPYGSDGFNFTTAWNLAASAPSCNCFYGFKLLPQFKMATRTSKKKNLVLPALSSSFCVYAFIAVDWSVICLNNKYTISEPDVLPSSSSLDFAVNRISPRASTDSGSDQ